MHLCTWFILLLLLSTVEVSFGLYIHSLNNVCKVHWNLAWDRDLFLSSYLHHFVLSVCFLFISTSRSLQCNKYVAKHKGTPGTLTHRVYLKNADNVPISPFHDIPLKVRDGGKIRHEAVDSIVDKMCVFFLINSLTLISGL